ncbi:DTW domain-containing protein [Pseudomonas guariconensis]|uniref:tRNA-uridine aminocarboxypropyltransferase n=1 Tax=Pseudomonas guariconensis TaxID=1288410 RepID=A0AAX0W080_9PSED|nr:DTW domain-containing protein [Pseudomonas guariconensis]MEB3841762.1 DTW domain-containing protein [Pseudomonas guariconensis]MEB3874630.1 DTW domain-containing protein [Pseudomonas guariconensis]MEB3878753.1 DTW domain-containing protein [Pseudomonas guariconensis]MEB3896100.1 DTW domain-containing protein [Pseudomonas guariconensis]PLV20152.1 DTW domain-containing protein [Pseudomonas guariconensis]
MSRPRCERCQRPLDHCLCPLIPSLDSRTRVVLLQHPSEVSHALNTARLAALGLVNAELRVGEVFDDLPALLATPGYRPVLLFPGEQAQVLSAYEIADDTPLLLIVPDGTWRKARKLLYLNPLLDALPRVTLGQVPPSRYRLRKAPEPGALSTIEAVVEALNALEGAGRFDALCRPFDALIEGQIKAMGRETFERNHG